MDPPGPLAPNAQSCQRGHCALPNLLNDNRMRIKPGPSFESQLRKNQDVCSPSFKSQLRKNQDYCSPSFESQLRKNQDGCSATFESQLRKHQDGCISNVSESMSWEELTSREHAIFMHLPGRTAALAA